MFIDPILNFNKTTMLVDIQFQLANFVEKFNMEYFNSKKMDNYYKEKYIISLKGLFPFTNDKHVTFHILRNPLTGYLIMWVIGGKVFQEHIEFFKEFEHWKKIFYIPERVV